MKTYIHEKCSGAACKGIFWQLLQMGLRNSRFSGNTDRSSWQKRIQKRSNRRWWWWWWWVTGNTHSLERHRDRGTAAQAHTRMYGRRKELPASTRAPPETTTPPSLLHFPRGIGEVPQNYNLGFVINGVSSCCIVSTSFH